MIPVAPKAIVFSVLVVLIAVVEPHLIAAVPDPIAGTPSELSTKLRKSADKYSASQRSGGFKLCGAYSLVYLLLLLDRPHTVEEVMRMLPAADRGASLLDLKTAARTLGLPLDAVLCKPASLNRLPLPAIAHLESSDIWPDAHYVVVLRVGGHSVTAYDSNARSIGEYNRREFTRAASGYFLVPHTRGQSHLTFLAGSFVLGFLALFLIRRRRRAKRGP